MSIIPKVRGIFRLQTSDFRNRTSHFEGQTSYFGIFHSSVVSIVWDISVGDLFDHSPPVKIRTMFELVINTLHGLFCFAIHKVCPLPIWYPIVYGVLFPFDNERNLMRVIAWMRNYGFTWLTISFQLSFTVFLKLCSSSCLLFSLNRVKAFVSWRFSFIWIFCRHFDFR
jgi:hypothetical protein